MKSTVSVVDFFLSVGGKKYGFDCLVLWEYDIWDEGKVVKRIDGLWPKGG